MSDRKAFDFNVKDGYLTMIVDIADEVKANAPKSTSGKTSTLYTTGGYNWATGIKGLGINLTVSNK